MVFHEPDAAAGEGPEAVGARPGPALGDGGVVRPLNVPLLCWHESARSARTDPLVALAEDAAFIATDRPVPVGTPVFLELSLGHASNAARAQIDAVVVSGDAPVEMAGFVVRFVDVDPAVLTWIQRHLASATQKRGAAAKAPEALPEPPEASPRSPLPPPGSAPLADEPWALPPPTTPNPFAVAAQVVRDDASDEDARADDDDVDDLPEMADFEELGAEVDELGAAPKGAPEPIPPAVSFFDAGADEATTAEPPPTPEPSAAEAPTGSALDLQVEEALGDLSADAAMEDAFSASFSPWVELPEGDDAESGSLDLAREPAADPFGADLPDAGGPLAASDDDDPPAPPDFTTGAEPAGDDDGALFDALPLPEEVTAVSAPAAAPAAPKAPEAFDPFADADEPSAPLPAAAAPLASDEFAKPAGEHDVDVDVEDDGFGDEGASGAESSGGVPGLAEAGVGFSNPFVRKASDLADSDDDIGELDATRAEIPRSLPSSAPSSAPASAPPAPPVVGETLPWGIDRQSVLDAAERRAAGGFGPPSPAAVTASPPSPVAAPRFAPSPAPLPPSSSSSRTTPEGLTPIFGTRPPSGLFRPPAESAPVTAASPSPATPLASAPAPAPAAPPPRPASAAWPGPPQAPEPSSVTTAPYSIAPGPGPGDAAAPGELPRAPAPVSDEIPRFAETQRFGVAPSGPPLGAGFPGGPAPSPASSLAPAIDETERYRIAAPAQRTPAPTAAPGGAAGFRTPTLEFPQPGSAESPAAPPPPRPHTPTLREFAAVSPPVPSPAPAAASAAPAGPPAVSSGVPPAPRPRSLGVPGLGPEDDVVEVSTTSQLVRASEGGLASLVAKDKAARVDLPMQSVTGGKSALTVEGEAFREPSRELDPFAAFATPAPSAPSAPSAPAQEVWFPGEPVRMPDGDPPTGVLGTPRERPVEAWQVRGPARAEPEELPVVAGVLEDDELPLVHASPLEPDPVPPASEPWVIGGPGRGPKR